MKNKLPVAACLAISAIAPASFAQSSPGTTDVSKPDSSAAPIAFVYVSNAKNPSSNNDTANVYAYTAASNGKLTPVAGSPLNDNVAGIAANGTYLFGANGTIINSYKMGSKGTLSKVESIDTATYNPQGCGATGEIKVDHAGSFLYNTSEDPDCNGSHFQFFGINKSTGKLSYIGDTAEEYTPYTLTFLGNDKFAYSPDCQYIDHEAIPGNLGFKQHSDGSLTDVDLGTVGPKPRESENFYCTTVYAADPTDHIAALLSDQDVDGDVYGNQVIATYTVGSNGKLATTSTYKNMPAAPTAGQYGAPMSLAPSAKYLAVGGPGGLEVFHFNGSSPVTRYKTVFTNNQVDNVYWDKSNHLYALGGPEGHGKLWVYTVTSSSITEAPGSPYSIPNPISIIVHNN
jgi:hypothetical protein